MRLKTDHRRRAILDAATDIFREVGYERASMAAIAARVGGSKTTLYNYFPSKEELFAIAMVSAMEEQSNDLIAKLEPDERGTRVVLIEFGLAYVRFVKNEATLAIMRTAVSQANNMELGAALYAAGPAAGLGEITKHLDRFVAKGELRAVSTAMMATHLKGLLEAGIVEPLLYSVRPTIDEETSVKGAVDVFLRAYAVEC